MRIRAAELKPYDVVDMPGEKRVVDRIEFHDKFLDSQGTTGVEIFWTNYDRRSLVAADKEFTVLVRAAA